MILKYLQGGVFTPPFVVYLPSAPITTTEKTTKKDDEKSKGIDMKDLLSLIDKLNGLPGDVAKVSGTMKLLFLNIEYKLNNPELISDTSSITNEYMQLLSLANNLKFQSKQYEKALNTSIEKGSLNEAAIDSRGRVMVISEDGYNWVTAEEYNKNRDQYEIITNALLLDYRALGYGDLAFNNSVLTSVSNGVGILKVTDLILEALKELGENSNKTNSYAYVKNGDLIKGLEDFLKALASTGKYDASVHDLYKMEELEKTSANHALLALGYIYSTLPESAKTLLKLKSGGGDQEAKALISKLIFSKVDTAVEKIPTLVKSSSDNDSDTNSITSNFLLDVQSERGGHEGLFHINNASNIGMYSNGYVHEEIRDRNEKHIGMISLAEVFALSSLAAIKDGDIYFGEKKLSQHDLYNIMYDESGLMTTILPAKDGKPNFELLEEFLKADLEFRLTALTKEDKIRVFSKYPNLSSLITPDGKYNMKVMQHFMLLNGITTDNLVNIEENDFVTKKDYDTSIILALKIGLSRGSGSNIIYPEIDEKHIYDFISSMHDNIYAGTIYIPINPNKASATKGVSVTKLKELEEDYQQRNIRGSSSSSLLINN